MGHGHGQKRSKDIPFWSLVGVRTGMEAICQVRAKGLSRYVYSSFLFIPPFCQGLQLDLDMLVLWSYPPELEVELEAELKGCGHLGHLRPLKR